MRFKNFEIRDVVFLDGHKEAGKYDLVKWQKEGGCESCFSIATIVYNKRECDWDFESVGLRYLECREDGLEEFIIKYLEALKMTLEEDDG